MIVTNYAIKFRAAVFVFAIVLAIAGVGSYLRLPREGTPDITIPFVYLTATYEGTAPADMEKLVTIPIEKQLNGIENVKEILSTSGEGVCTMSIEFYSRQDIDMALQKVKDKVDLARPDLPPDLDEPVAQAVNFSTDIPILILALSGDPDPLRLKSLAEELRDAIELLPGVKEAAVSGTREREIRVEFDAARLAAYGLPTEDIVRRIRAENATFSAGNIELAGNKFQVRVPGEFDLAFQLADMPVAERGGRTIYLRDVAAVTDSFKDVTSISRLSGRPSVSLSIKKRNRENTVLIVRRVNDVLKGFPLPPGVDVTVVMDQSEYIASMVTELENNIASGFILVFAVLILFMGGRNSLFVALAIPLSLVISFTILELMGSTLNMIVLFSLVLAVGMLVDNAIVIVENIYRHRTEGESRDEAARNGAAEVAWPVVTSTLTTVAAFGPLLFWPDIMGQFMHFLPVTLIVTLSASLFVGVVINPAVCSVLVKQGQKAPEDSVRSVFTRGYERILRGALRHRPACVAFGFAFLAISAQLYARFGRGIELFPDIEPRSATITVKFPEGTAIEHTDRAVRSIEETLRPFDDIKFVLATVGSASADFFTVGGAGATHAGTVYVEYRPAAERKGNTTRTTDAIRDAIGAIAGAEVTVEGAKEGPPTGKPISIEISGDDFESLVDYATEAERLIGDVPGLVDVRDDLEDALPELQFTVDRERAAMLGLDTSTIGSFLRTSIYGTESSRFRADEDEYDITLRLPADQRNTLALLDSVFIPLSGGGVVPLSSVGTARYAAGRGAIKRKDLKRVITISGNNQGRGVDKIIADLHDRLDGMPLRPGYAIRYTGDTEEMRESGAFLARAFVVAIGLILVILVLQFNSPILPLIIISSVALSLVGVIWGLLLCRMRFGVIMTGVGVISLAGVVVNNAIVLIDCALQQRAKGLDMTEALVKAGRLRMRPVLLTASTTVLGLIPMAIGYSIEFHSWPPHLVAGAESSAWWAPMAVAVIFGLTLATILTLIVTPVMVSLSHSLARLLRARLAPAAD